MEMAAPNPIPTLPITSATAAQSAHIASLTTQLHQLVEKNNSINAKLELALKEGRERVNEEVRRSDEVVRLMRRAHDEEMKVVKDRMEMLRISAVHAQHSIAYAHQVTKTDLLLTEQALAHQKRQNALQSAALVRAAGVERLLQSRLAATKTSHAIQQQALLTQLEQSSANLVAAQTRGAAQEDKLVTKLKNQLDVLQISLNTTQDNVKALQGEKEKVTVELAESQTALEELRREMKEERKVRKEHEREVGVLKEQVSARDTTEATNAARDAETTKAQKRRVKELEVALAAEKGRVAELEGEKAKLEKERRKMEKRFEKEREVVKGPAVPDPTLKASSTKKKDVDSAGTVSAKSKKRPREEEDDEDEAEEGVGLVIQGAFGLPDKGAPPKKHKKAKLDDSDTEQSKPSKPSKPKPSKPTTAISTTTTTSSKPTTTSSKPKKAPTAKSLARLPPPSSPPPPSPSPISTPQFSDDEEEEEEPVVVKTVKKPAKPALAEGTNAKKPAVVEQTATTKKKFKVPPPPRDDDDEKEEAGNDSDDFAAKKAKFFGGSTAGDNAKGKKATDAQSKKKLAAVKEKEKAKEEVKTTSSRRRRDKDEDEDEGGGEVFDLDAVSDTSDGEDLEELVKKPKGKEAETGGKTKAQSKPRAVSKAPTEPDGTKPFKKTATTTTATTNSATATAASKGKGKGDKVVEVENAPAPAVTKPKKRTFNLLGSTTNNALTGNGLNAFGSWGGGLNENIYNIPSQLSSPEKGGGLVPRAKFGN